MAAALCSDKCLNFVKPLSIKLTVVTDEGDAPNLIQYSVQDSVCRGTLVNLLLLSFSLCHRRQKSRISYSVVNLVSTFDFFLFSEHFILFTIHSKI